MLSVGDYWVEDIRGEHINVKEMWAIKGLQSPPEDIHDYWIDAHFDNMVAFHSWLGWVPHSRDLTQISQLFPISFIPSNSNQADWFSRRLSLSDAMLSAKSWDLVQLQFGGIHGHDLDLMSLAP